MGADSLLRRRDTGGQRWLTRSRDTSHNSRTALAGADPALVQDALYDAEDYLRTAVAEGDGTPGSYRRCHRGLRHTRRDRHRVSRERGHRRGGAAQAGSGGAEEQDRALAARQVLWCRARPIGVRCALLRAPRAGDGHRVLHDRGDRTLADLWAGDSDHRASRSHSCSSPSSAPFRWPRAAWSRAFSACACRDDRGRLGVQGNLWTRIKSWLADYRTWTTMLYMVLQLPLGIVYFTIMVTSLAVSAAIVALPIAQVAAGAAGHPGLQLRLSDSAVGDAAGDGAGGSRLLCDAVDRQGHRVRARAVGQDDAGWTLRGRRRATRPPSQSARRRGRDEQEDSGRDCDRGGAWCGGGLGGVHEGAAARVAAGLVPTATRARAVPRPPRHRSVGRRASTPRSGWVWAIWRSRVFRARPQASRGGSSTTPRAGSQRSPIW